LKLVVSMGQAISAESGLHCGLPRPVTYSTV